ncbi:unnamed protein product [Allacma fusca]|uniref:Uncharacterized protein n=1 Tax=Allacma fusca TaxID=39272 RepID=A0A8J2NQ55_9HEXA|nr:unnamed protein product [Allacma fusca]
MTSFNALASEEANSTIASQGPKSSHSGETIIPTEVGKSNDSEDSQDLFPQQLQENYRNGFLHIFGLNGSFSTTINKRLEELEKDSFLQTTMLKYLLKVICTELYPRSLLSPIRGPGWTKTFSTNSIGQIAAAIPDNYALAVEIVNYLNVKLTNYELYLQDGLEHHRAQTTVFSKSREVMTFKYNLASYYPTGILLYRKMSSWTPQEY